MHSRLFVLRPTVNYDGETVALPSMNDRSCVTEDELCDSFVPNIADYIRYINHDGSDEEKEDWKESSEWIAESYDCFTVSVENGETFVTLDVSKGLAILHRHFDLFKEKSASLTKEQFADPWSMEMYELKELMNDKHGFYVITIEEKGGWYYETMDEFLRSYCGRRESKYPNIIKFRLEDIYDYHF